MGTRVGMREMVGRRGRVGKSDWDLLMEVL